jgi:hypothetical protein
MELSLILRKLRKSVATFSAVSILASLVLTSSVVANAASFTDVASHWAKQYIEELTPSVFDDGATFRPDAPMNRAEFSKVMTVVANVQPVEPATPSFTDVPKGEWFYKYVEAAKANGIVSGDTDAAGKPTGTFRPADNVNRAEAAKMLVSGLMIPQTAAASTFSDVPNDHWARPYIMALYNTCVVDGKKAGVYEPASNVTRGEMAKMISMAKKASENVDCRETTTTPDEDEEDEDTVDVGTGSGTLKVALSAANPEKASIPKDGIVLYTAIDLTAEGDSVDLAELTIKRFGVLGSRKSFQNVWVVDNETKQRVGGIRTLNQSDEAIVSFGSTPIMIPAGKTVTLWLAAKMDGTQAKVGEENSLGLEKADGIKSSAREVAGQFPVRGEEHRISDASAGQVEVENISTSSKVDVGETVTLFKATFQNKDDRNRGYVMESMVLKNEGTENLDVLDPETIVVSAGGQVISKMVAVVGDYLYITFDPAQGMLTDKQTRTVEIKADLIAGDQNKTIKLVLKEEADFFVRINDISAPFGVDIVTKSPTQTEVKNYEFGTYTINAGEFTVRKSPDSPASNIFLPIDESVPALITTFKSSSNVLVKDVLVKVSAKTAAGAVNAANLDTGTVSTSKLPKQNVELSVNEKAKTEATTYTNVGAGEHSYSIRNIDANMVGEVKAIVYIEFENVALKNESYRFEVAASDMVIEYDSADNDDTLAAGEKTGTAKSDFLTINDEEIEIATVGLNNQTYVAGSTDRDMMCFTIKANNSGSVKVDDITVQRSAGAIDDANAALFFSTIMLVDEAGEVLDSVSKFAGTPAQVKFEDLESIIVLQPAQQKKYCVRVGSVDQAATGDITLAVTAIEARDAKDRTAGISTSTPLPRTGGVITFAGSGSLNITVNSSASTSKIIASGAGDDETKEVVIAVNMTAVNDDVYVDEIAFENEPSGDADNTVVTPVDTNIINALSSAVLVDLDTNAVLADSAQRFVQRTTATPTNRVVLTFNQINNNLLVPRNVTKKVGVRIGTDAIDALSKTGTRIRLKPTRVTDAAAAADVVTVKARSKSSGNTLNASLVTPAVTLSETFGNEFVTRRSVPSVKVVNTNEPWVVGGNSVLYRFIVEAQKSDISLSRFTVEQQFANLRVNNTNYEVYTFVSPDGTTCPDSFLNSGNLLTQTTLPAGLTADTATFSGNAITTLTTPIQIIKDEKRCFVARNTLVEVGAPSSDIRSSSFRVIDDAASLTAVTENLTDAQADINSDFIWSDNPGIVAAAAGDVAWSNGFRIPGLPTQPVTRSQN